MLLLLLLLLLLRRGMLLLLLLLLRRRRQQRCVLLLVSVLRRRIRMRRDGRGFVRMVRVRWNKAAPSTPATATSTAACPCIQDASYWILMVVLAHCWVKC